MGRSSDQHFATTHWSLVHDAARQQDVGGREALSELCQSYWYPLYSYLRRKGLSRTDAEDVLQSFFVRLLEHESLALADPARGKFRSFLATALQNFLANELRSARAVKRGGGVVLLSFDFQDADRRFQMEPLDATGSPEDAFDRQWAWALVDSALKSLEQDWMSRGKQELFEALRPLLTPGSPALDYETLAEKLGMTAGALRVAAHRFRQECGQRIRDEIRRTVATDADVEDELRRLFALMSRG